MIDVLKLQGREVKITDVNVGGASNLPIKVVDSTIQVPVDIQGSTIQIPTDLQKHKQTSITILASSTITASGNTADIDVGDYVMGEVCVDVTAVSGTSPTLDLYLEGKSQLSGKYKVIWNPNTITGITTLWQSLSNLAFKYIRLRWVVGGTSPSFTLSCGMEAKA